MKNTPTNFETTPKEENLIDVNNSSSSDGNKLFEENKPAKKKAILKTETLEELIDAFYAGKLKIISYDRIKKLKIVLFDMGLREDLLIQCVKSDPILEKSLNLLIQLAKIDNAKTIQHSVTEFIKDIVIKHPSVDSSETSLWFPLSSDSDELQLSKLFNSVSNSTKINIETNQQNELQEKVKKDQIDIKKARLNIFYILVIWRFSKKYFGFNQLVRELRSTVYKLETSKETIESHILDLLINSHGKEVNQIACLMQWFFDLSANDRTQIELHRNNVDKLTLKLSEAENQITSLKSIITNLENSQDSLKTALATEMETKRIQGIHQQADQKSQKGRTVTILEKEISELQDCMTAIERNPPKIAVAKQYLVHAIEILSKEVKELKGCSND